MELPAEYCAQGERFRRDVARNATGGFWWKGKGDEMRAVTQNPNATLDIHVDASVTAPGSNRTAVLLFTAKSHDKIGNAGVRVVRSGVEGKEGHRVKFVGGTD